MVYLFDVKKFARDDCGGYFSPFLHSYSIMVQKYYIFYTFATILFKKSVIDAKII